MDTTTRETLGPYRIIGALGAGGMGEVYVARDPSLGRTVAIKVLPQRLSSDRESLSRFTREARSASALNHPNIVTIHEVGMDGTTPYMVMEHIEGKDLRTLLHEGPLSNRRTLNIAAQIADGLAAAHEKGIVHRDLKPENVMVTKDGFVKILDFGLAKVVGPAEEDADTVHWDVPATNPGTIVGTVGYMSPEQAHGKVLDFHSDQFSLGAILYELATGKPAFSGENALDTMTAIVRDQPKPISDFNSQAPAAFVDIVEKLLAKDAARRFASTRDAARDLHNIHDYIASTAAANELPRPPLVRRRTLTAIAIVAAILIVGAAGIAILYKPPPPPPPPPAKRYIAVTQFKDLTGDPNGQLVVDGLSETLAARLARFKTVQVMRPATPADAAAAASATPEQVARNLGANIVLTGSMQRAGERLRVVYEIHDVEHNTHRSDLTEGAVGDLFGIQDRLADSVASTLHLGAPVFHAAVADTSVSQGRYLEALGYLRRYDDKASVDNAIHILDGLAVTSGSASVQAALGRAYLAKYQLSKDAKWADAAAAACERGIRNDPENFELHITLGQLRRLTGRYAEAIAELKQALAQQPNSAEATLELAVTYQAMGNLREGERAYEKAIQLNPKYWSGYNKLGFFYFVHGRYPEAEQQFKEAIRLLPKSIVSRNNLASVYQETGRYEEAIELYEATLKTEPTTQAYSNLGTIYYDQGRFSDSAAMFEKAVAMNERSYRYWANLGDAYRYVPELEKKAPAAYDRAIELLRKAIQLNAGDVDTRSRLAECLAKRGQIGEARTQLKVAMRIDPKHLETIRRAAVVATLAQDYEEAVRWLKKAVDQGYNRTKIDRDPEFAILRQKPFYRDIMQPSNTIPTGPQ